MSKIKLIHILQLATVGVFLGRAWQHIFWDSPFRTLLWDEGIMKGIVEGLFSIPWEEYIANPDHVDVIIENIIVGFGIFYLICALMAVFIQKWEKVSGAFMILGSLSLVFLAMLYCKEKFFSIGQFFEYALQFSSPLFLYYFVKGKTSPSRLLFFMKVAIALTFVCHGLYAVGYYPRPGNFTEMTMNILGLEEEMAISFLNFAGLMDFVIGIGIFLPIRYSKWVLYYAIFWGFFTTIARIWNYVEWAYFIETTRQYMHESIYRAPHFLIPLFVLLKLKSPLKDQ